MLTGASIAHKLATKVYAQRITLVEGQEGLSTKPQAELAQQLSYWSRLWDCE